MDRYMSILNLEDAPVRLLSQYLISLPQYDGSTLFLAMLI